MERTCGEYQIHCPAQAWAPRAMASLDLEIFHIKRHQNLSGSKELEFVQAKMGWFRIKLFPGFQTVPIPLLPSLGTIRV